MLAIQVLLSGITSGSIYAIVALGFVLIYKGTRVVHFGLGEQVTLGAYLVVIGELYAGLPFYPAVAVAIVSAGAIGLLLERCIMRPLRYQPVLVQIIATLAIGLTIREGLRAFMGPHGWPLEFLLSPAPVSAAGIFFAWANIAIVAAALLVMVAWFVFFAYSRLGQAVLAACENPVGAYLVGVPVRRVISLIWIMASVLAAVAGILIAPIITLSPEMGLIGIKGFTAAVLGGFTSLPGAVAGGFLLGVIETATGTYTSSAMKDATTFVVLVLVIILRPHGLFGFEQFKKV
jgi:branched-chain amino acid transport system permease protein